MRINALSQDTETGLYYLQSRYYDPATMRFINADDPNVIQMGTEEKQELNLYAYCLNDPVNSVDPSGYWTIASEANRLISVLFASIMALKLSGAALIAKVSAMILAVAPYLFVVVAVVAVSVATYYLAKKIALDKAIAKVKNTVKRNSKNRYWTATIQSGYVSVGRPLTYSQAVKEVASKRNVFAVTSYEAKAVARAAGGNSGNNNKPLYPEIHGKSSLGYYWHYHTYNRKGGHVFYLFG